MTVVASRRAGFCSEAGAWLGPQPTWQQEGPMSQIVVVPGPGTEMHYASNHLRKTPTFSLQKGPQPSELAGGTNEAGRARAVLPGTGPPRLAATCGLRSGLGAAMHNCRVMTRTPGWDTPHSQDLLRQPKKGCTPTATQTRAHRGRHALPQPIIGGQEHPLTSDLTPRAGAFTLPGGGHLCTRPLPCVH